MKIINFSIIAHIDHGKSTLANKLLEVSDNKKRGGTGVDGLELEKERGITIKSKTLRFYYKNSGIDYQLNMIDTPGHVDFSYEVSKALYACDYTFLLVDATKGIQAQTISNAYKALDQGVEMIPVINKIDMQNAKVKEVEDEITSSFGFSKEDIFKISAKTGEGVKELLDSLVNKGNTIDTKTNHDRALIFDSFYDEYLGVIALCLVEGDGFSTGDDVYLNSNDTAFKIQKTGYFNPEKEYVEKLKNHEVGFIVTGLKDLSLVNVGDTIFKKGYEGKPFPGFEVLKPLVFLGVFTKDPQEASALRKALDVLHLADSSFTYKPESTGYLGYGFNCGFLGLLHADIIIERIKREHDIDLVVTSPSVSYLIKETTGEEKMISSASEFPDPTKIEYVKEPFCNLTIISPDEYVGNILNLVTEKRGEVLNMKYSTGVISKLVTYEFKIPLAEIVVDFNDRLKSLTSGYASMSYEVTGYEKSDIVKLDIYIAKDIFEPLSQLVHKSKADSEGRRLTAKLKEELPRKQFPVAVQAAIGGKIIARETIPAFRKDVTAKLYGGDRTRKDKLLAKQKEGKKRMTRSGTIDVDKDTFFKVIKRN